MKRPSPGGSPAELAIWRYAFGYFACYAPYSALTKALTDGALLGSDRPPTGFELLPMSVASSLVVMVLFLAATGLWRTASRTTWRGLSIPRPSRWTFLSGLCTACIIGTTTLAYTFSGVSIVFVMLLMRGGVLVIAPIVDRIGGRTVRWFSWAGFALSLASLLVAFSSDGGYEITLICAIDIGLYLASYFVRFRFMSRLAKSPDAAANRRYFVEEQLVAPVAALAALALVACVGGDGLAGEVRAGFLDLPRTAALPYALLIGALSQGTGVFGSLIFLDPRENTYCVPVNRSSSVLAGVLGSYGLVAVYGRRPPSVEELAGAALIVAAIVVLTLPPILARRRAVF